MKIDVPELGKKYHSLVTTYQLWNCLILFKWNDDILNSIIQGENERIECLLES